MDSSGGQAEDEVEMEKEEGSDWKRKIITYTYHFFNSLELKLRKKWRV